MMAQVKKIQSKSKDLICWNKSMEAVAEFFQHEKKEQNNNSPGEDRTPDLRISHTVYKYDALTYCATGERWLRSLILTL